MNIPIIIGVTGHRNLCDGDLARLREIVRKELLRIQKRYPDSSLVMLNSLAEGADQLCAEAAAELGISLVVPLPMNVDDYIEDFKDEALKKFKRLLATADDVFVSPCTEKAGILTRDYYYRQAGIFIAAHSHVLLALWDGKPAKPGGGGTADVVDLMLNPVYAGEGSLYRTTHAGSVLQVVTPRKNMEIPGDAFTVKLLGQPYEILDAVLQATDEFNSDVSSISQTKFQSLADKKTLSEASEKADSIHNLYQKADALSVVFRDKYLAAMKGLSLCGVVLVLSFLLYDEVESNLCLIVYGIILIMAFTFFIISRRGKYHRKYLEYRALAETLRVQFYLILLGINRNIADEYTWTQKNKNLWIRDTVTAALCGKTESATATGEQIEKMWIDNQLAYHERALAKANKKVKMNSSVSTALLITSIATFMIILVMEFHFSDLMNNDLLNGPIRKIVMMHDGQEFVIRGIFKIVLGVFSAITLFLSNYYGKLSLNRKISDHEKMIAHYKSARERFQDPSLARDLLFLELAKEEIVENGNWFSYCSDNTLTINF